MCIPLKELGFDEELLAAVTLGSLNVRGGDVSEALAKASVAAAAVSGSRGIFWEAVGKHSKPLSQNSSLAVRQSSSNLASNRSSTRTRHVIPLFSETQPRSTMKVN
jgi:hypothetical protein